MAESSGTPDAKTRIVVSYSGDDQFWAEQLVSAFPTELDFDFFMNRADLYGGKIDGLTKSAIAEAKALILLLSPSYLATSWISNDESNYISQFESTSGGLNVVPVLIRECPWQDNPFLQKYAVSTASNAGKPIADAAPDLQPRSLTAVAGRVLHGMGLSHPDVSSISYGALTVVAQNWDLSTDNEFFKISLEVRRILGFAWACVQTSDIGAAEISSEILLVSFSQLGRFHPRPEKTPQFLWKQLSRGKQGVKEYESLLENRFPGVQRVRDGRWDSHKMPPATNNTQAAFRFAAELSHQTYKPRRDSAPPPIATIGARHLLAALLVQTPEEGRSGAIQILSEITDISVLRNRFFDFIVKALPDDNHEEWRRILVVDVPKKVTKARTTKKAVAESVAEGNVEPGNIIQQTAVADIPLSNDVETPSSSNESVVTGSGGFSIPGSSGETSFSELEAELSAANRPQQDQQLSSDIPISEDQVQADTTDDEKLDLRPILAGFATDYWDGRDLLDTETDVNALASLVSAWSVEPPLSIGLFGDWGSGKSHFMRQMRKRVETLSKAARKATDKNQKDIGYYKNIVQIEFNAWHYIEGNLWASLVDHIFANLRVSEEEEPSDLQKRRDQLMDDLKIKEDIKLKLQAKIEDQKAELVTKQLEANRLAEKAKDQKQGAAEQLAALRSSTESQLNELTVPFTFSDTDEALLARLGIKTDKLQTVADYRKQFDQLDGIVNRIRAQWKLFRTDPKERRRTFFAALLALIPLAGVLLLKLTQIISIPGRVAAVLGVIATVLTAAAPTWNQIRKGKEALREKEEAIELERQKRMSELEADVHDLTQKASKAEQEAESIDKEIADLNKKIDTLDTGKILAEFIEDRAAATDYRRHLGLLALIRRDFEKLRKLFEDQRKLEKSGKESLAYQPNRINRIVLYIDDLDRCPPQRVVEVLQAIHLLLAFPIFVVVVGVDARWVTRSLQESYEWLRLDDEEDDEKKTDKAEDDDEDRRFATPHDYLEKIFQIPFWLRPMEEDQTKTFIKGLTDQIRYKAPAETHNNSDEGSDGNKQQAEEQPPAVTIPVSEENVIGSGNGHPTSSTETGLQTEPAATPESESGTAKNVSLPATERVAAAADSTTGQDVSDIDEREREDHLPETTGEAQTQEQQGGDKAAGVEDELRGDAGDNVDPDDVIDLAPQSLTLGDKEIEYMQSLAKLIGRSPRAIKRFLNCYRLIKVSLKPKQLNNFVRDGESYQYKAVMILLGMITGAPTVSLYVMEELEKWDKAATPTIADFLDKLAHNEELVRQRDWNLLKTFLTELSGATANEESLKLFAALRQNSAKVSRYSFRVTRAETTGPKRPTASPQKKSSTQPPSNVPAGPKASS